MCRYRRGWRQQATVRLLLLQQGSCVVEERRKIGFGGLPGRRLAVERPCSSDVSKVYVWRKQVVAKYVASG
jgi:hypothetical protein